MTNFSITYRIGAGHSGADFLDKIVKADYYKVGENSVSFYKQGNNHYDFNNDTTVSCTIATYFNVINVRALEETKDD